MEAIRLENLRKAFRGKPALHGVSFAVQRGEIFGLLGHNGAGKSTSLGILLGQVFPDEGEAFIGGISPASRRSSTSTHTRAFSGSEKSGASVSSRRSPWCASASWQS